MTDDEPIAVDGPNLCLSDLRWLLARCDDLDPGSRVVLRERRYDPAIYERITVLPRLREGSPDPAPGR